jgi:hypothetical protein
MNLFWGQIFKWMIQIFGGILGQMTPTIFAELREFLERMYAKAIATPNPIDDFAIGLLLDILSITRPDVKIDV